MKKASNVKTIVESQAASASAAASSPTSKSSALRALAAALAALVLALCVGFMSGCSSNSYTPEPSEQKIDNSLLHTPGTLRVGVDASMRLMQHNRKDLLWVSMSIQQQRLLMNWV